MNTVHFTTRHSFPRIVARSLAVVTTLALAGTVVFTRYQLHAQATPAARVTKDAALDTIVRSTLIPGYTALALHGAKLDAAATALATSPTAANLQTTQRAWIDCLLSWRRVQPFLHGPIADLDLYAKIQFWPLRKPSIDRVLNDKKPIDAAYVDELGATAVGLFPLETLIFNAQHNNTAVLKSLTGPAAARRREYVRALAHALADATQRLKDGWQGPKGYGTTFATGGQASINLLFNDLLMSIEMGAQDRLRLLVDWQSVQLLRPDIIEGGLSLTSQSGLLALVSGVEEIFNGKQGVGLDDYLRQLNPATARRVSQQFQKAVNAVRAINGPIEAAMAANPATVRTALDECRALEIILKTEAVSALGVTLTFRATDGD